MRSGPRVEISERSLQRVADAYGQLSVRVARLEGANRVVLALLVAMLVSNLGIIVLLLQFLLKGKLF